MLSSSNNQKEDKTPMLNDNSCASSDIVVMTNCLPEVTKSGMLRDVVIGNRPTSSHCYQLNPSVNSAARRNPGENRCCWYICIACVIVVLVGILVIYYISAKMKHKG